MGSAHIRVSWGELADKISILTIKSKRILDRKKIANVRHERAELSLVWYTHRLSRSTNIRILCKELDRINGILWDLENRVRFFEQKKHFKKDFVVAARSIYFHNDERAKVKRAISLGLFSNIIEEKEHASVLTPRQNGV